jgi:mono/diheme cytochrome c family protein/succinate dehydrogenase hydrophobic anchor subunit
VWFATFFFTKQKRGYEQGTGPRQLRNWVVYRMSHVVLVSLLGTYLFGTWYWSAIPETMKANSSVALLTQEFMSWHGQFQSLLGWTILVFAFIGLGGLGSSFLIPRWALLIPSLMGIWLLGHFERAREFMRKPWVIGEYMYSNGVHKDELAFLQSEGLLKHATYAKHREVTEANKVECGKDVFMLACSRCHSTTGLNGVIEKFTAMYGADKDWDSGGMALFIQGMHQTRTFMPPFPGNDKEAEALVAFIQQVRATRESLPGAQSTGVVVAPPPAPPAMTASSQP